MNVLVNVLEIMLNQKMLMQIMFVIIIVNTIKMENINIVWIHVYLHINIQLIQMEEIIVYQIVKMNKYIT